MAKSMGLTFKILSVFFILNILFFGFLLFEVRQNALKLARQRAFNFIKSVRESKKKQIEWYFEKMRAIAYMVSENKGTIQSMKDFKKAFFELGKVSEETLKKYRDELKKFYGTDFLKKLYLFEEEKKAIEHFLPRESRTIELQYQYIAKNPFPYLSKQKMIKIADESSRNAYDKLHEYWHPLYSLYAEIFGFHGIALVDHETGSMVYTVGKKVEFATSLLTGPYKETNLARAFKEAATAQVNDFVKMVDFEVYEPSWGKPSAFIATPIFDGKTKVGVLVAQLDITTVNNMVTFDKEWLDVGLGESGEVYLIGSDYKVRSTSRVFLEKPDYYYKTLAEYGVSPTVINKIKLYDSPILFHEITEHGVREALKGKTNVEISVNYYGKESVVGYTKLKIQDLNWFIVALIDTAEFIDGPINRFLISLSWWMIGLLILFLIASFFCLRYFLHPFSALIKMLHSMAAEEKLDVEFLHEKVTSDELGVVHENMREWFVKFTAFLEKIRFIIQKQNMLEGMLTKKESGLMQTLQVIQKNFKDLEKSAQKDEVYVKDLMTGLQEISRCLHDLYGKPEQIKTEVLLIENEKEKQQILTKLDSFIVFVQKLHVLLEEIMKKGMIAQEWVEGNVDRMQDYAVSYQAFEKTLKDFQLEVSKFSQVAQQLEQLLVHFNGKTD